MKAAPLMSRKRNVRMRELPGHLFRRLHQLAVARFATKTEDSGLTPMQWAALAATLEQPGLDQSTLSRATHIDTSTLAGVVDRLEARGLIQRRPSPDDRRLRLIHATDEGRSLFNDALADVLEVNEWLLEPLSERERVQFMALINKVLDRRD
jgi:DNA-binding MarR family transcriptional regulator